MKKEKEIKRLAIVSIIISVLCLTIAFLSMSKVIIVDKKNVIADARWDVHFDDLEYKTYGDAKIIKFPTLQNRKTYIGDFEVSLTKPGDKVTFFYDIVNAGTLRAKYDLTYVNDILEESCNKDKIIKSIYAKSDWDGDGITTDEEIIKSSKNIVIKDKIFKGTLQSNEIQKGSLTISFIGDEVPKGEVKLNINLKYDFVQK
ncbi:MAG: hypothetical protein ACI4U0_03695 [Candidatus Aphodocola sp.]